MYDADPDAVQAAWHALVPVLHAEGLDPVPATLAWPTRLDAHWRARSLLLSQTCGYPLVTTLRDEVQVVGAFRYSAPGCSGIDYASALVVRRAEAGRPIDTWRGRVAAINDPASHSGCNALRARVAPLARDGRFFAALRVCGSHRRSIEAVREGRADIAAIDCVTLAGLRRLRHDALDGLDVLGMTPPAPGLPLVTAAATSPDDLARLRRGLARACADTAWAPHRQALFIDGFEARDAAAWQPIETLRRRAGTLRDPVE